MAEPARKKSRRLTERHEASESLFINWLQPKNTGADQVRVETDRTFNDFEELFAELDTQHRPLRMQTSDSNCVLYALWTTVEVMTQECSGPPPFMKTKIGKEGVFMRDIHSSSRTQHYLASKGLKTVPVQPPIKKETLLKGLRHGALVVGIECGMFDDENFVRRRDITRELLDRKGNPTGKYITHVEVHSVCIAGFAVVQGKGYFITKDTQSEDTLGTKNGLCLLPEEDVNEVGEMYVLHRVSE